MAIKNGSTSSRTVKKSKKTQKDQIIFPKQILAPMKVFLIDQLQGLKKVRKDINANDPFRTQDRTVVKAAPDSDAEEQFGHARSTAMKEHIDRRIIQTRQALSRIKIGAYGICEECGNLIDTDRLMIKPEATLCVKCEAKRERKR